MATVLNWKTERSLKPLDVMAAQFVLVEILYVICYDRMLCFGDFVQLILSIVAQSTSEFEWCHAAGARRLHFLLVKAVRVELGSKISEQGCW